MTKCQLSGMQGGSRTTEWSWIWNSKPFRAFGLWMLQATGRLWHDATHAACSSGELPNYGGKGSCVAIMESFSNSGLGKGRASFYMEIFWGKLICRGQDQHLRDLAWWTVNWAADFSRSVVWCVSLPYLHDYVPAVHLPGCKFNHFYVLVVSVG